MSLAKPTRVHHFQGVFASIRGASFPSKVTYRVYPTKYIYASSDMLLVLDFPFVFAAI